MVMQNHRRNKKTIAPSGKGIHFVTPLVMKKKILVADDDPGIRDIFRIILVKAGYDLQIIEDANEIFENNFEVPDVFLIDKLLSGVDGLDVCRLLKTNPLTSYVSVVMVSASPDIGPLSIKAGADDYIEKPFDINYLLQVLERNIDRTKKERQIKNANTASR
jgi:DNA-binding response OmpR family regulator